MYARHFIWLFTSQQSIPTRVIAAMFDALAAAPLLASMCVMLLGIAVGILAYFLGDNPEETNLRSVEVSQEA